MVEDDSSIRVDYRESERSGSIWLREVAPMSPFGTTVSARWRCVLSLGFAPSAGAGSAPAPFELRTAAGGLSNHRISFGNKVSHKPRKRFSFRSLRRLHSTPPTWSAPSSLNSMMRERVSGVKKPSGL